ncbi:hypothetical protein A2U01_0103429, partial [Trifolium medium]|nr:hypothetical protein [Trifolium medium]
MEEIVEVEPFEQRGPWYEESAEEIEEGEIASYTLEEEL